jgi:hypothetical protein
MKEAYKSQKQFMKIDHVIEALRDISERMTRDCKRREPTPSPPVKTTLQVRRPAEQYNDVANKRRIW